MIHIVINNSTYPDATIVGVYRDYKEAISVYDASYNEDAPWESGLEIVSWDIINNCEVGTQDDHDGGGTPVQQELAA